MSSRCNGVLAVGAYHDDKSMTALQLLGMRVYGLLLLVVTNFLEPTKS